MDTIELRLKRLIVASLQLEETRPEDIGDEQPLFGADGLGLDSVDALEIVMEIERNFGVALSDSEESRKVLRNVKTIAEFVRSHGTAA